MNEYLDELVLMSDLLFLLDSQIFLFCRVPELRKVSASNQPECRTAGKETEKLPELVL